MNDYNKSGLIGWIDRSLDGRTYIFTKRLISEFSRGDLETASACLKEWEANEKLIILKPLDQANDDDEVVKMKSYIEGKSPWPNWPPK